MRKTQPHLIFETLAVYVELVGVRARSSEVTAVGKDDIVDRRVMHRNGFMVI